MGKKRAIQYSILNNGILTYLFNNNDFRLKRFVENVILRETARESLILDIGAGEGRYRDCFVNAGHKYFTQDYIKYTERIDFIADACAIPVAAEVCDSVMSLQVLEHLKEPDLFFKECRRILKPGGSLFLSTNMAYKIHMAPNDFFRFTEYGLRYLGEKNRFEVIYLEKHGGAFHVLSKAFLFSIQSIKTMSRVLYFLLMPVLIIPLILVTLVCTFFDFLDKEKILTLNYAVYLRKKI